MPPDTEVIIVGGGPAGLSAALVLGRACRQVRVFDDHQPRNRFARQVRGYLTRDGITPAEFLERAREDLRPYPNVIFEYATVSEVACQPDGTFAATLADGRHLTARKMLLATGVVDHVPEIPGFRELYGRSVFHCPFCDGWEYRDRPLAVYGRGRRGFGLSMELLGWSRDVVLCTDGPGELESNDRGRLDRNGILVREAPIARLDSIDGRLSHVVFEDGERLSRDALLFTTGQTQSSRLAQSLGCHFNPKGTVDTGRHETTHLPGLYVAGDASRDVQWVVVAAAEGAEAAFAITQDLIRESWKP